MLQILLCKNYVKRRLKFEKIIENSGTFHCEQGTASEATLVALLAARSKMVAKMKKESPEMEDGEILCKLVCYTSDQVSIFVSL